MSELNKEQGQLPISAIRVFHCLSSSERFEALGILSQSDSELSFQAICRQMAQTNGDLPISSAMTNYLKDLVSQHLIRKVGRGQYLATDFGRKAHQNLSALTADWTPAVADIEIESTLAQVSDEYLPVLILSLLHI